MLQAQECVLKISETVFTCSCCNSALDYVQQINGENCIENDYFVCESCGSKIESVLREEEEVPAFFD